MEVLRALSFAGSAAGARRPPRLRAASLGVAKAKAIDTITRENQTRRYRTGPKPPRFT